MIPVVAIDGPSGVGKGTMSAGLAQYLGWHLLDSGAIYRLLAYDAQQRYIELKNETVLAELALSLDMRFEAQADGSARAFLGEEDVTAVIRTEAAGNAASQVAAWPAVRAALLERQRQFQQAPGLVADGRDMGSVVFPDASLKIYLTASAEERANRRYKQLIKKGLNVSLDNVFAAVQERDERDSSRATAPLKPADDALILDTSDLTIEQVFERLKDYVAQRITL
jgi:cytidylate kinase